MNVQTNASLFFYTAFARLALAKGLLGRYTLWAGFVLLLLCPRPLDAQNKKELEQKRQKIMRDIETTDRMLKKTTQTKEATYDRFVALQTQIKSRENLIQTLTDEIAAAEAEIEASKNMIDALQTDIATMREDYGRMLRSAYRRKSLSNPLLFVLSAENFNQAFRRWLFLRKYDRYRRQQGEILTSTQASLTQKIAAIRETRAEKSRLLGNLTGQKETLNVELGEKNGLIKTLTKDEARLKNDLVKKQAAYEVLNRAIEKTIEEEVDKRAEANKKNKPATTPPKEQETPAVAAKPETPATTEKKTDKPGTITIVKAKDAPSGPAAPAPRNETPEPTLAPASEDLPSGDFRRRRGKLPWPVERGFISRGFGRQKHPTLKNIEITNNGIDIRTDESAEVSAVFGGKIAGVQFIPGHNFTIIIQHGDYYTVYSNLSDAFVKKGETVAAEQPIGKVSGNPITGTTELHFELWLEKERLNPAGWIKH